MKEIQVSEQALSRLEATLNHIQFKGIPVGGLIASAMYVELYKGNGDWSLKARMRDNLSRIKLLFPQKYLSKQRSDSHLPEETAMNKALITFSSSRRHIFNMSYEYWKTVNEDSTCFLLDKSALQRFSEKDEPMIIFSSDVQSCSVINWRREFKSISRQITKELEVFTQTNAIPGYVAFRITNYLIGQTQKLLAYQTLLEQIKPRYLLVEYDRFFITSPLVLAARLAKVPSFTMVHGTINNKIGYLPILADRLFCWGNAQQEQLRLLSKNENNNLSNVEVIGAPQITRTPLVTKAQVREKIKIPVDKKVVLLATNPTRRELRHRLISIFCDAMQGCDKIQGIVRLHPSEQPEFYRNYIELYPNILIDVDNKLSYDDSLAIADIVCIYNSAFGFDAIFKHIPTFVIKIGQKDLGQAEQLISHGKMPVVKTSDDLIETIKQYFQNDTYRLELKSNVDACADYYCAAYSVDAAKKMNRAIISFISRRSNQRDLCK